MMSLKKLNPKDKARIFEMVAALALLAGQEMSNEGYNIFNDTVLAYFERYGLLEDFKQIGEQAGLGKHPNLREGGFC